MLRPALLLILLLISTITHAAAPDLILASEYSGQDVRGWAMSEKLDGVRAYWDGHQLISRAGHPFHPPAGFLADYPPWPLDGELYSTRGAFEHISGSVRRADGDWTDIHLHVFDVPQAPGTLYQRLATLHGWLKDHPQARIRLIPQIPIRDPAQVDAALRSIEAAGGEGVMLREPARPYHGGRSPYLLKHKSAHDAECTVIAHHTGTGRNAHRLGALTCENAHGPGKGKHAGRLGAITCENEHGRFRIGSGFSDAEREQPPAIGSTITYRYRGYTKKGTPRFATYLRPRTGE